MILRHLVGFGNCPGAVELNGGYALTHISIKALRNLYKMFCMETRCPNALHSSVVGIFHICRLQTTSKQSVKIYSFLNNIHTLDDMYYFKFHISVNVLWGGGPSYNLDWIVFVLYTQTPAGEVRLKAIERWIFLVNHNDRSTSPDSLRAVCSILHISSFLPVWEGLMVLHDLCCNKKEASEK